MRKSRFTEEQIFGVRSTRSVRDYEKHLDVSKAMIHVAMVSLLPRRIVHA